MNFATEAQIKQSQTLFIVGTILGILSIICLWIPIVILTIISLILGLFFDILMAIAFNKLQPSSSPKRSHYLALFYSGFAAANLGLIG